MDRDSAEKEVARRIARANDDLRTEFDVDEGKVTQFMTPLHKAAQAGSVEQVQALLDRFVEIDPVDVCSESPLHLAARQGYADIICKHGPSVNATKTHCCENNVDHDMHLFDG